MAEEFEEGQAEAVVIRTRTVLAILLSLLVIALVIVWVADDAEAAPVCGGSTVVAIGGFNDPNSAVYNGKADIIVRHSGQLGDIEGGVAAFDRAVRDLRAACPGTHVIATGFSQGAAVVQTWLQRNQGVPNKVGVLFSNPRQNLGDTNFGGTTTVSICRRSDVVCNFQWSNIGGYPREHLAYDFMARKYAGQNGIVWQ